MQKKQLIIFDMDGTIIDSGEVISNTVNFVRTNLNLPVIEKNELLSNMNNPNINSAEFFYGSSEFTDEQTELFSEYYNKNCISDILLYNGIQNILENLKTHFVFSIATNTSIEFAKKMLEHLKIDHYFDFVIGANEVNNPKPHPEMLLNTSKMLNIPINQAILIGDSSKDKKAAEACKMDYILVNWGFSKHDNNDAVSDAEELQEKLLLFI